MATDSSQSKTKRVAVVRKPGIAHLKPPSQTLLRSGITALNKQAVVEQETRWAERARVAEESRTMIEPLIEITRQDKEAVKAAQRRRQLTLGRKPPKVTFPKVLQRVEPHVRAGSILTFVIAPYDAEWGASSGSGGAQTTWGTWVAIKSAPEARFNSTTNVGDGGSAWSSAGVGKWFVPAGRDSWVRIGFYAPYQYDWRLSSTLETAHSHAFIGIYVQSFNLRGGDPRNEVDRRISLWSQGTSWYQDHSDAGDGYFPSDTYFHASGARQYVVWAWCHTAADASSGSIAYSYAWATLSVALPFMVFEEWT